MSTSNVTNASPLDPLYNDLITLIHTKLPQELYDQIEATVFEMVFCPGHLYFNVSNLKTSDTDAEKPANVARPELLCLSKDIHRRYVVRMWQENDCVVKTESRKVYDLLPVKGHLRDPLAYLDAIGEDQVAVQILREIEEFISSHPIFPGLDSLPDGLRRAHDRSVITIATSLKHLEGKQIEPYFERPYNWFLTLRFLESYSPSGEWLGLEDSHWELPKNVSGGIRAELSFRVIWKAVLAMSGRTKDSHRGLVPEMANQERQVEVKAVRIWGRIYLFT
ncbi:MAG: hypothetical protein LQ339_005389 [Xanthoria mediterranea]|nr:MAG: hypothetical protein LQ339_005389 [Xanthoria mediterranea]